MIQYCLHVPSLEEAHDLSHLLFRVAERARSDFVALAAESEMTAVQARCVLWLWEPSSMSALAEHLSCDASNVTGIADRLGAAGVVERVSGSDRRVKMLQLTGFGHQLREKLADRVAEGSTVIAKLEVAERQQLASLLEKLLDQ